MPKNEKLRSILADAEEKMDKSVDKFKNELKKVRTGRASVGLIEDLKVDYYGTPTPLNQIASLSISGSTIFVQPWDKTSIKQIEKAILSSGLGYNVSVDGDTVRVNIPPLTEERKKEFVKLAHDLAEEAKIAIRNIRHHALNHMREVKKNHEVSEDDERRFEEKLQKATNEHTQKIEELFHKKEKEIMEV